MSVIIPTFNRKHVVCRAVRTCLVQRCVVEVIVVDDGSTDGTAEVIAETFRTVHKGAASGQHGPFADRTCVRYITQPHQGVCAARNRGLCEASGEFVKFLDSDDELVDGALAEELRVARESKADVVVSAWEERIWGDGHEVVEMRCRMPCPNLACGVDDMLQGAAPWTAAALYRRAFVVGLRWNSDFGKADDWGWAWTVCLAGANFAMTECVSSVYWHHAGDRVTSVPGAFTDSTTVRQRILEMVESSLARTDALTAARRQALSQYYYKDRLVLCDGSPAAWRRLWQHCQDVAPGFRPTEWHRVVRLFVSVFGVFWGVRLYVTLRRWFRGMISVSWIHSGPHNSPAKVP